MIPCLYAPPPLVVLVKGINANGDVTGEYFDSSGNVHGFLRTADGTIVSFDVKNSAGTEPSGINGKDAITGAYVGGGTLYGFERTPDGKIKKFEVQASRTLPEAINDKGMIAGEFYSSGDYHGFVGSPKSGFTSFDVPGGTGTESSGINNNGDITGSYDQSDIIYGIRTP